MSAEIDIFRESVSKLGKICIRRRCSGKVVGMRVSDIGERRIECCSCRGAGSVSTTNGYIRRITRTECPWGRMHTSIHIHWTYASWYRYRYMGLSYKRHGFDKLSNTLKRGYWNPEIDTCKADLFYFESTPNQGKSPLLGKTYKSSGSYEELYRNDLAIFVLWHF